MGPYQALLIGLSIVLAVVTGSYLQDVELFAPSPWRTSYNTVYYYPSYVKGEDPVEEYNRRRLHVDTGRFMMEEPPPGDRWRKIRTKRPRDQRYRAPMRVVDAQTDHDYNYWKIRKVAGLPRYVKDDVELFDVDEENRIKRGPGPERHPRMAPAKDDAPRRYEESDPQVFAYGRSDTQPPIARANDRSDAPGDSKYFQDTFLLQKSPLELEFGHLFESNDGWEERYERQDHQQHRHQGKVKWADKKGGFGEHYWDLNHVQADPHEG
ncbi:uncharacterized protein LOC131215537 [Anopheles bellator]|uniref:uncharacterized protein LOC131215537 n=1 Tax=Anopheles bellator TaxID=139047 RepID=UPI0026476496|nr:uncharacterized protein LOC131215537 [Anopheles bellator]